MKEANILVLLLILILIPVGLAQQNGTMTVKVNVTGLTTEEDTISIEVPDSVSLKNVMEGEKTDNVNVHLNNTGSIAITITPQLSDPEDILFQNIYFKNTDTISTQPQRIGNYSLNIARPSIIGTKKEGHCWMGLDLTNFTGKISGTQERQTDILFIALPQS